MKLLLPLLLAHPLLLAGQAITLTAPNAKHPTEFSGIAAIRELADGRVIIMDTSEKRLFIADFKTGKAPQLGMIGDGPQEYRNPLGLFPMRGDSTLLTTNGQMRWIFIAGDRPVVTIPPKSPAMGGVSGVVRGVDATGRAVTQFLPQFADREVDQGDSLIIARFSRPAGRGDTVARLLSPFGGAPGSARKVTGPVGEAEYVPSSGKRDRWMHPIVMEQVAVFTDGWIAVARQKPYQVDWIDPAGKVQRGTPLPVPSIAMDDREKRFYLGLAAASDGKPAGSPADIKNWLPSIPPFWGGYPHTTIFPAPDGSLVITRALSSAAPRPSYDVVARSGQYLGKITLGADERIVGFGVKSIYTVRTGASAAEFLERHPWP